MYHAYGHMDKIFAHAHNIAAWVTTGHYSTNNRNRHKKLSQKVDFTATTFL